jgi:hypothetical protein
VPHNARQGTDAPFFKVWPCKDEQDETIQSRTLNVGSFAFCVGERLCRPSLHVDGC